MGILNVTPDSFYDGGKYNNFDKAVYHAEKMIENGANIIDVGGASSRPGSREVSIQEELDRVLPVIEKIREFEVPISIDTCKPEVLDEAIEKVDLVNDINGFKNIKLLEIVKKSNVGLCVMHMKGSPENMQLNPNYHNVLNEIIVFLKKQTKKIISEGISKNRICVDPGFGFGKNLRHNLILLDNLSKIESETELPVLVGLSRKSMIGLITGKDLEKRLSGSLALAFLAVNNGARIIRVHDVEETYDFFKVLRATKFN